MPAGREEWQLSVVGTAGCYLGDGGLLPRRHCERRAFVWALLAFSTPFLCIFPRATLWQDEEEKPATLGSLAPQAKWIHKKCTPECPAGPASPLLLPGLCARRNNLLLLLRRYYRIHVSAGAGGAGLASCSLGTRTAAAGRQPALL